MIPARCPKCFSRLGSSPEIHLCPQLAQPKPKRKPKDPTKKARKSA